MRSDGIRPTFTRANSNAIVHGQHKDLPVSDLSFVTRFRGKEDCRDCRLHELVVNSDLKLYLTYQMNFIVGSTLRCCSAFLPSKTLTIDDR